ncbi:hypothetical protein ACFE04_025189 [Oxalis oulophora]
MGKSQSPGKWIKGLFGKRSTKSNLTKQREVVVSAAGSNDQSLVSQPTARVVVDSERVIAADSNSEEVLPPLGDSTQTVTNLSGEDAEKLRQEEAAITAQAAFRGYQARFEFRSLKGIIRLQALIRGRFVRRQAVVTFHCVRGIVKFQALARGRKVRCSDIGIEVQKSYTGGKFPGANSSGTSTSDFMEKLSNNAFICKLLTSSTSPPLRIQYVSGEPNSDWEWLERWTLHFVQPKSDAIKPKKQVVSKSQAKRGGPQTRENPKRSLRTPTIATSDIGLTRSSDFEKPKRNPRKTPTHVAHPVQEHSQNGNEKVKYSQNGNKKVKHGIRKVSDSVKEASTQDVFVPVPKQSDGDELSPPSAPAADPSEEIFDNPGPAIPPVEIKADTEIPGGTIKEFNSSSEPVVNGNHKSSQRRASLPIKIDQSENGIQSTPKVPSYMAPTESAKARLRGQGSPRFVDDVIVEKNDITRRHSLPNGKLSSISSPRVSKLVQAAGKGGIRTDRSFSSSRDGFGNHLYPHYCYFPSLLLASF